MDKSELLNQIQKAWTQVDALLGGLTDEQFLYRRDEHEWSLSDMVAHLTFWQQTMVTNLQRIARNEAMTHIDGQLDDINAQVYAANQSRPPALVLSEFRSGHAQLVESLQALTDEDLNDKTLTFRDENPLWEYILGESAEHYTEHLADMRAARERAKQISQKK